MKKTTSKKNDTIIATVSNNQKIGVKVYQKFNKIFIDREDDRTFYIDTSSFNTMDKGLIALVEVFESTTEIFKTVTYDVQYDEWGNKCSNNENEAIAELLEYACEVNFSITFHPVR